ncbi:hypothetical protein Fleli_0681 [Bernardetia litoralis DSM 6794]|uniref:DUF3857 domain-containing protein n=1 Tax=Bernardetia litoralis (strain ATCC 23117 / DSM 6794 / NBRC 15988 / NCIMB 1366 / Fx l1 / Sio-4) TaxID=880071 RepID=I4AGQ9_BERLS|nr:DUF3857 domain-containing protein [Bernardetia litoralis]AFM03144.1 hypothetical protein Fleli_0681 [Bernardetia litoralis DSM 6794]
MNLIKSHLFFVALLFLTLCSFSALADGNKHQYADYDWEENRQKTKIPSHLEDEVSVVFLDKNMIEYFYLEEEENIVLYKTHHVIRWLGSTDAVERYNAIFIPLGEGTLEKLKVRSISPDGKVVISDQDNLKEIKDEESGRGYKMFAIEGIEKGSEIEYFYTTKEPVFGGNQEGREYMQSGTFTQNILFELISPSFLDFEVKSYNGLADVELTEDTENEKRIQRIEVDSITPLNDEPFAYADPNKMRVDYKLAYNLAANSRQRFYTFTDAARQIYSVFCQTRDKKEEKALKKIYKGVEIKDKDTEENKIRKIENYLKVKVQGTESPAADFSNIEEIEKTKIANERGLVRLFTTMLELADVDYELVLTVDRSDVKFDADFDYWGNMREFLIYFPNTKKYLVPAVPLYRYGIVPDTWTATNGLFIRRMKVGEQIFGMGTVRTIEPLEGDQNFSNIHINMKFNEDMDAIESELKYGFGGLSAVGIQSIIPYLSEEKRTEMIENVLRGLSADAKFENIKLENEKMNTDLLENEFAINTNFSSKSWVEKAGNKYLFTIGKCIGPQSELYQEKERKLAVENGHNRIYKRKLIFEIPEGYQVKNLDDLKLNIIFDKENTKNCGFTSDYKQKGNTITVDIFEYYYEIYLSLEDFEEYRKVINAAADFNKIVLVVEKK